LLSSPNIDFIFSISVGPRFVIILATEFL